MRNLSYENEFCMQFHSHANQSHFHNNGFALILALKQRHKGTRKWPIVIYKFGVPNPVLSCLVPSLKIQDHNLKTEICTSQFSAQNKPNLQVTI